MKLRIPLVATIDPEKGMVIADCTGQTVLIADEGARDFRMLMGVCDIINSTPNLSRTLGDVLEAFKRAEVAVEDIESTELAPRKH
jgi:hypothetical protein